MIVTKESILSGKTNSLEIPMTNEQWERYIENKEHVQYIFPELSPELREFLISGITPEEWSKVFEEEK